VAHGGPVSPNVRSTNRPKVESCHESPSYCNLPVVPQKTSAPLRLKQEECQLRDPCNGQ